MIRKNWFILLFAALLLSVMTYAVPVFADDEIICEDSECEDIFDEENGIYVYADGTNEDKTLEYSIYAEEIGAELIALNSGSITLNTTEDEDSAPDIYGAESGMLIDAGSDSRVTANTAGIDSDRIGLGINADAGATVEVTNQGMLDGYNAFYVNNNGGKVSLKTDEVQGVVGIGIISGSGETTVDTTNINAEEYGVAVDVSKEEGKVAPKVTVTVNGDITDDLSIEPDPDSGYDRPEDPEEPEEPDDSAAKAADGDDPYSDAWWSDAISGTEETPAADAASEDTGDDIDEGETVPDPGEDVWEDDWEEEDPEGEGASAESVNSTGVVVSADGSGSEVTVTVSGKISAEYGNEIEAAGGSKVTVSVSGDVETDYGNRVSAEDADTTAVFDFGGNIHAGGVAIDTYTGSGTMTVTIAKDIKAEDSKDEGDYETIGIYSNSEGSGKTQIEAVKGIEVSSRQQDYTAYGIETTNIGGELNISVGENVSVKGSTAIGISVVNDPDAGMFGEENEDIDDIYDENARPGETAGSDSAAPVTNITVNGNTAASGGQDSTGIETRNSAGMTNIKVYGDVSGSKYGMDVSAYGNDRNASFTDILVTGTISGKDAGLIVNEEANNDDQNQEDNLRLTVWKIDLSGSKNAAQDENGKKNAKVEDNIRYIIRIAEDSLDKITVEDENGDPLPTDVHDLPYAKKDAKVYVRGKDGYDLPGVFNGRTPLVKDGDRYRLEVPNGGGVLLSVNAGPDPVPPSNSMDFHLIDGLFDRELPHTGFSARSMTTLPARPRGLIYGSTGLTLQIPVLDVREAILSVPVTDNSYPVEWLDSAIGILEGSSLPGEGITVLTGHNHLNTSEIGPFLFLNRLEAGDRLIISDSDNEMRMFRVYGNYKIASDGFASVASDLKEDALVLITCEDESLSGGYLNRRVIFAEPM